MIKNCVGIVGVFMAVSFISTPLAQAKKAEDINVVEACKADCPEAKSNAEAHECAERKGKIRPSFKKTKCWEVNETYEHSKANADKVK